MKNDIRWKQRFQNFENAYKLLSEAAGGVDKLNRLEKEGMIQRFEFTLELAWKTLKDKMEFDGVVFDTAAPRQVLRQAYKMKYIDDAQIWFAMLADRNLMSHTYDIEGFERIVESVSAPYLKAITALYVDLKNAD